MQPQSPMTAQTPATSLALSQNRVLRNTYYLLALSMVPTVLGAWLGVQLNLAAMSPFVFLGVFLVGAFGLMFAVEKTKNSSMGVVFLLLFTFFMGVMLSRLLGFVLPLKNSGQLIGLAFGGTAVIFAAMATAASTIKRDLSFMGKGLFIGVVMLFIAAIANVFLQMPALMIALSVIAIGLFSVLMLYDLNRIMTGGETNYISATLAIYLDIYNVFSNLLALLGIFGGERD